MAFTVVYDANVLYPSLTRNVLIRLARAGLVQARILAETFRSLARDRPDIPADKLDGLRKAVCDAVPDCLVEGFEEIESCVQLPDPDDRHVVAAAIRANAQVIVTFNTKDFPADELAKWDIEAKHPDDFVLDLFHIDAIVAHQVVSDIAAATKNPPLTVADVVDQLERNGLPISAAALRR